MAPLLIYGGNDRLDGSGQIFFQRFPDFFFGAGGIHRQKIGRRIFVFQNKSGGALKRRKRTPLRFGIDERGYSQPQKVRAFFQNLFIFFVLKTKDHDRFATAALREPFQLRKKPRVSLPVDQTFGPAHPLRFSAAGNDEGIKCFHNKFSKVPWPR